MRMRRKKGSAVEAAVMMSPLIDCVFLLLIFFLVTSIIKRYERQIPVTLSDPTSMVSREASGAATQIGVDRLGMIYVEAGRSSETGRLRFQPIDDLATYLDVLRGEGGGTMPLQIVVERGTPFQTVINVLDICEIQGFEEVCSRLRDAPLSPSSEGGA